MIVPCFLLWENRIFRLGQSDLVLKVLVLLTLSQTSLF